MSSTMVHKVALNHLNKVGPNDLNKAFLTALLLTGFPESAERSVEEAIEHSNCHEMSGVELTLLTVKAALQSRTSSRANPPDGDAALTCSSEGFPLPPELTRVLALPTTIRHSFVLRRLVGLTASKCSELLKSNPDTIDSNVIQATILLARISEQEEQASFPHLQPETKRAQEV